MQHGILYLRFQETKLFILYFGYFHFFVLIILTNKCDFILTHKQYYSLTACLRL